MAISIIDERAFRKAEFVAGVRARTLHRRLTIFRRWRHLRPPASFVRDLRSFDPELTCNYDPQYGGWLVWQMVPRLLYQGRLRRGVALWLCEMVPEYVFGWGGVSFWRKPERWVLGILWRHDYQRFSAEEQMAVIEERDDARVIGASRSFSELNRAVAGELAMHLGLKSYVPRGAPFASKLVTG